MSLQSINRSRLKSISVVIFCLLSYISGHSQTNAETVTNQSVISLVKAGLDKSIIITTINNAQTDFDISTAGLTSLKKQGVPNEVIAAIVDKATGTTAPKSQTTKTSSTPPTQVENINHPYISNATSSTILATEKSTADFKAKRIALGYGGANYQYELSGVKSNIRIPSSDAVYFLIKLSGNNIQEYTLYKADVSGNKRIAVIGKFKTITASAGLEASKSVIGLTTTEENNLYKLTPSKKLETGEYVLAVKAEATNAPSTTVFSFGVD